MINEDYCSYEVAKLLKEKGFNWSTQYVYTLDGTGSTPHKIGNWRAKSNIQKPTLQMAMKWLREKHGIFIGIQPYDSYYEERYGFEISTKQKNSYEWNFKDVENSLFEGYTETIEAAIKYCLENLI